jgi:hypothetical protein
MKYILMGVNYLRVRVIVISMLKRSVIPASRSIEEPRNTIRINQAISPTQPLNILAVLYAHDLSDMTLEYEFEEH